MEQGQGMGVDASPCLSLIIPNRLPLEPGRKFPEEAEGKEAVFGEARGRVLSPSNREARLSQKPC